MDEAHEEAIAALAELQNHQLSIIRLSEPISATNTTKRSSDVSADTFENPSPASLAADLTHYKARSYKPNCISSVSDKVAGTFLQIAL